MMAEGSDGNNAPPPTLLFLLGLAGMRGLVTAVVLAVFGVTIQALLFGAQPASLGSEALFDLFQTGIIPQARQTVASMLAGYQVNKVDFLNLVGSQVTLLNYEIQYWKALTDAHQALARLRAAVGEEQVIE